MIEKCSLLINLFNALNHRSQLLIDSFCTDGYAQGARPAGLSPPLSIKLPCQQNQIENCSRHEWSERRAFNKYKQRACRSSGV